MAYKHQQENLARFVYDVAKLILAGVVVAPFVEPSKLGLDPVFPVLFGTSLAGALFFYGQAVDSRRRD
ncbi:MAG: DUF6722 family protein [Gammaproteobacteria bacterium]